MREKFTFSDTPWITTTTDFFAALDFDYGVGPNNGERDTLSQLSHRLCLFFVFQWFGEVINPDLVLRDFVQNLKKFVFNIGSDVSKNKLTCFLNNCTSSGVIVSALAITGIILTLSQTRCINSTSNGFSP